MVLANRIWSPLRRR